MGQIIAPISLICRNSECNMVIYAGQPVRRVEAGIFEHVTCPQNVNLRTFAAHKAPDTGMYIGSHLKSYDE